MCGIAGIFNYKSQCPVDSRVLNQMVNCLVHRGPDEEGFYLDDRAGVGLGHRRLSIIDLETGQQPMSNSRNDIWIVFNGEIYNYKELKKTLENNGHHFRTTSDTEVIIELYEAKGERAFENLNGIFAFAIYDKRNRHVVIARDHFGVKPLYYAFFDGKLIFGSEIKTILLEQSFQREIDYEGLNSFLTFRYNPSPQTLFKHVKKLLPGHYLKVSCEGKTELKSYWNYIPKTDGSVTEKEAEEEYVRLLECAVRRQLVSDVPVGLFLSGGVDSAMIGYLMQKNSRDRVKSFTVGFPGNGEYNELQDAARTAELINSDHFDLTISQKEYLRFLPESFYFTEEPIAEPITPALYYVAKLAGKHLKVVLSGQGADELFAGYHRYIGNCYISRYSRFFRKSPIRTFASLLPRNERFKRAAYVSQFSNELQRYLAIYSIFTPDLKERLLRKDKRRFSEGVDEELVKKLYQKTFLLRDTLSRMLFIDARMSLSDDLLLFNDKMTMANSLEMRVPFLDVDLVKFVESLPGRFKLKRTVGKYIHKKTAERWIPKEIVRRRKRGFATPIDKWLQSDLAETAQKVLVRKDSAARLYFDVDFIEMMIEKHRKRRENFRRHIFALLSFELWHKNFFERA